MTKLKIIYDSAIDRFYWVYDLKDYRIESKRDYKNPKICRTKALHFALKQDIPFFDMFVAKEEQIHW